MKWIENASSSSLVHVEKEKDDINEVDEDNDECLIQKEDIPKLLNNDDDDDDDDDDGVSIVHSEAEVIVDDDRKEEMDVLEWTIETMMHIPGCRNGDKNEDDGGGGGGMCVDPRHYHSFSPVTVKSRFLVLLPMTQPTCIFCQKKISTYDYLKCVACQATAHRSCAFATPSKDDCNDTIRSILCPVNTPKLESLNNNKFNPPSFPNHHHNTSNNDTQIKTPATIKHENDNDIDMDQEEERLYWSTSGPPNHWASTQTLQTIAANANTNAKLENSIQQTNTNTNTNTNSNNQKSLFQNVGRMLQEHNILLMANPKDETYCDTTRNDATTINDNDTELSQIYEETEDDYSVDSMTNDINDENRVDDTNMKQQEDLKPMLEELAPKPPPPTKLEATQQLLRSTSNIITRTNTNKKSDWVLYAAGSVAGLVIAGPAGVLIGAKVGQVASVLAPVIVEGTVSVSVLAASGMLAWKTAKHSFIVLQKERTIPIGNHKSNLVLVRPGIIVDPIWQDITTQARQAHHQNVVMNKSPVNKHKNKLKNMILRINNDNLDDVYNDKEMERARQKRFVQDSDLITAKDWEIPTEDKIMLLVTRMLNDRMSLPGYVYRCLIHQHKVRSFQQLYAEQNEHIKEETTEQEQQISSNSNNDEDNTNTSESTKNSIEQPKPSRIKRQDTHAVIKHVTGTLLEVRPGFAASPRITEMSATAVERLVFGELYDSIFDEIVTETRALDEALQIKITQFDSFKSRQHYANNTTMHESIFHNEKITPTGTTQDLYYEYLSDDGLDALRKLPESHTAVEKLSFCVQFLELISLHFNNNTEDETKDKTRKKVRAMGADALLKMVCQHIIAAKVPNLNAEIAFVEEFARDEQLLRGKEGYTLVTLQASLNFLNASEDFDTDIFYPNDE